MRLFRFLTICGIVAVTSAIATGCATSKKATPAPAERPPEPIARIQDALKEAQDAAAKEPQNARNQYRLGNALFDAERFDGARAAYEAAIKLDPGYESAYCNLGLCLKRLGLLQESMAAYRKALELDASDGTARFGLVSALEAAGEYEQAVQELQVLAEQQPKDVQIAAHLGNALFRVQRYKEAASAFEKVLSLDPGRASHYYNLGLCFFCMENWDGALATWLTALAHDSKDGPTNKGLAVVYWKRGDYKQAWEAVSRCQGLGVALDPEFISDLQKDSGQSGP